MSITENGAGVKSFRLSPSYVFLRTSLEVTERTVTSLDALSPLTDGKQEEQSSSEDTRSTKTPFVSFVFSLYFELISVCNILRCNLRWFNWPGAALKKKIIQMNPSYLKYQSGNVFHMRALLSLRYYNISWFAHMQMESVWSRFSSSVRGRNKDSWC